MKYTPEFSNKFNKRYKKYLKIDKKLREDFRVLLLMIIKGIDLPVKYKDHKLKGDMMGMHDCHLRFDLVLICYYVNDDTVVFVDIGSHKEIFGN